jgi:hypothetical protein
LELGTNGLITYENVLKIDIIRYHFIEIIIFLL